MSQTAQVESDTFRWQNLPPATIEVGSIWEARHGEHVGLRVEVSKIRPHAVQVILIGGGGFSMKRATSKKFYTIPRDKFLVRYVCIETPKPIAVASFGPPPASIPLSELLRPITTAEAIESVLNPIREETSEVTIEAPDVVAASIVEATANGKTHDIGGRVLTGLRLRANWTPEYAQRVSERQKETTARALARLTPEQVAEIRQLRLAGEKPADLARAFHVATPVISTVIKGIIPAMTNEQPKSGANDATRRCGGCGNVKPIAEFWGGYTKCIMCESKRREPAITATERRQRKAKIQTETPVLKTWTVRRLVMRPVEESITIDAASLFNAATLATEGAIEVLSVNPVD